MWLFWATDSDQKSSVFPLNLSSHYHILIAKYLFTREDYYFENLSEMRNVYFRSPSVALKRRLLKLPVIAVIGT